MSSPERALLWRPTCRGQFFNPAEARPKAGTTLLKIFFGWPMVGAGGRPCVNARKWHEAFLNRRLRMDFDHAIAAHSSWKMKLSKYLAKPDHSLQPKEIAPDDRCDLGKWIVAEGKKFANLPGIRDREKRAYPFSQSRCRDRPPGERRRKGRGGGSPGSKERIRYGI